MRSASTLALALALALSGCTEGEGEERLVVRNADSQPLSVILVITQDVGGIRIFGEEIVLNAGQEQERPLSAKPGVHTVHLTTSTRLSETLRVNMPETGDSTLRIEIQRGKASITLTQ